MKLAACMSIGLALPALAEITTTLLNDLSLFSQYSAAAYCSMNLNSTGAALACSVGNCPLVEAADTQILYDFDESCSFGDASGFVAVDNTNNLIVLSFRGSHDLSNWIANLDFFPIDTPSVCEGCSMHVGFWETWQTVAANVTEQLQSALATYPGYTLVMTGHSLGAALAAIAATVFRNSGIPVEMYNYGQPRLGNLALAQYITNQTATTNNNYRVTHTEDPVPKLPPRLFGFDHYSPEYWITSGNNVSVTDADVVQVVGIDSTDGNDGTILDDVEAHRWYLGYISECS
ncbi:hypothetical protein PISL3812_01445 [Talaromyces islandicus]|uniref:Lipase n=1 Tax=Talaromyces islandicus TaxID=28573 RepID=A0A0U1LM46_TALIS|nr:hypothetical protein PISL3812_01445 [Talaromyces islandicus]